MKKCFWKQVFISFLLLVCAVSFSYAKQKKVRVGLIEYPGYCYRDTDGIYRGIDVEMVYRVAQTAGYSVEIYAAPYSASRAFDLLAAGRIDVMGDMIKVPSRESKYLFSDVEEGHNYNSVYVSANNDHFLYGDIAQLKKMTFGCEKSVAAKEMFVSWCRSHGFTPVIKEFNSYDRVNAAIDAREIDAGLIGADSVTGYRVIQKFIPTPYYFMFAKNNLELKNDFDSAMEQILQKDPLYIQKLNTKYFTETNKQIEAFTREEKQYVQNHPIIKVAVWKDYAPYFQNIHGEIKGIIPEYYAQLSKSTGLLFSFVEYETKYEAIRSVHDGENDILAFYTDDIITAALNDLNITEVYTTITAAEVSKSNTEKINTIVIIRQNERKIKKALSLDNSTVKIETEDSISECFNKMRLGKVDSVICSLPAAVWLINQHNVAEYKISTLGYVTWNICGALRKENVVLCSILDKAIVVSGSKMQGIISANTMQEKTFSSYLERIPKIVLAIFVIILILLVFVMAIASYLLHKRHVEVAAVERAKQENAQKEHELTVIEKNTEEKNMFFSNISHDMRTPLNAVIGFSDLALKEPVNEQTKTYLEKIKVSGNLLLELINDTLTISKINSGKLKLNQAPLHLETLFDSIIIPIKEIAGKKHITFTIEPAVLHHRLIMADELNIQKIFLNLLTNAVKYTPEGGHVLFKISGDTSVPLELVVTVKDDGIGMTKEFIPHIYEPFAQEHRSLPDIKKTKKTESVELTTSGTGLGLSIVKRLVDLMGGTISVETEINKGTQFTVCLHFSEIASSKATEQNKAQSFASQTLSGKKVLVCEDNSMNREIVQAIVEEWGMIAVAAENGKIGVEKFAASKEGEYAAILMDLRMPELNGYEATRAIRSMNRSDAVLVPVIALTADAFEDDAEKCYQCGMNAHVSKPVDQEKLHEALCRMVH